MDAVGVQGSELEFRMFFKDGDKKISPWHDIPLKASSGAYNFVCEIPKESSAKMECAIVRLCPRLLLPPHKAVQHATATWMWIA